MSGARYRRKVWVALRSLLDEKAQELDITIEALEIMPDHVHLFIQSDPTKAAQRLANPFKGYSSRRLGLKYPELRSRLPSRRSRSYYIGTIGQVSEEIINRYIGKQKSS